MKGGFGFFRDSSGNRSFGRMASFCLVIGGIFLALIGRDYGAMLASALAFYATSKAQQAYSEGKNGSTGTLHASGEVGQCG